MKNHSFRRVPVAPAALLLIFIFSAATPVGAISWSDTLEDALERARTDSHQASRPVLLLATAGAWCDPCVWMERNTLEEPSIRSLVNAGFIPVRILDTDPAWEQWEVSRVPTIIIIGPDGNEYERIDGAVTADVLQQQLAPLAASLRADPAKDAEQDPAPRRDRPAAREETPGDDALHRAVFRIGTVGTLWNDGGENWYSQDAGLPPRLEEYDRDETFLYLRDRATATLLGVPFERTPRGSESILWRWNREKSTWEEAHALQRLD